MASAPGPVCGSRTGYRYSIYIHTTAVQLSADTLYTATPVEWTAHVTTGRTAQPSSEHNGAHKRSHISHASVPSPNESLVCHPDKRTAMHNWAVQVAKSIRRSVCACGVGSRAECGLIVFGRRVSCAFSCVDATRAVVVFSSGPR